MTHQAQHAVKAAKHFTQWGFYATIRYCQRRGVPLKLLGLALALEDGTI